MLIEDVEKALQSYKERIDKVNKYVKKNFPYGYRHKHNPQTKRSVFEAISIGVWLALEEGKEKQTLNKEAVKNALSDQTFMQYACVANELHKKQKLNGRVKYIYDLVSDIKVN